MYQYHITGVFKSGVKRLKCLWWSVLIYGTDHNELLTQITTSYSSCDRCQVPYSSPFQFINKYIDA